MYRLSLIIFCTTYLFFSQQTIFAQKPVNKDNFYNYYEAESLYQEGDTLRALNMFENIFANTEFGSLRHIYNTINKAIASGDKELLKTLIKSGTRKGAQLVDLKNFVKAERNGGKEEYADLVTNALVQVDSIYYYSGLDSFLITELLHLEERDQLFRDENPYNAPEEYGIYIDSLNFLTLKKLIKLEGGKLPSYRKIGPDGSSALSTVLIHLYINMISDIFPAIVKSIHNEEFFDAETILYQIDRNHIGGYPLHRYDKNTGTLVAFGTNKLFHDKVGSYQYYGFVEISDMKTRTVNYWPFFPDINTSIQHEMYDVLKIIPPFKNPQKSHFKKRSDQDFINLLLNQK